MYVLLVYYITIMSTTLIYQCINSLWFIGTYYADKIKFYVNTYFSIDISEILLVNMSGHKFAIMFENFGDRLALEFD